MSAQPGTLASMGIFRRRGSTALAEKRPDALLSDAELEAEIETLAARNRARRRPETEQRLVTLRHLLGSRRLTPAGTAGHPPPDEGALPSFDGQLPEIRGDQVTPGVLRAAILRDGCLLVRGLIDRAQALALADEIDRSFALRERYQAGEHETDGYYAEFQPLDPEAEVPREWVQMGGGVLAADSPRLAFTLHELFAGAGLPALVGGYLGEEPLISAEKTTLRKALPSIAGAWHQDGKFMGDVRALNLWLSLSRCGDVAPGLDIVPRRLDLVATQTDEALLNYQVSQRVAEEAAGERGILRPIFEPGDALFFDDVFLHKTGSDPSMPNPRFAVECWFFGASGFPAEYSPIVV